MPADVPCRSSDDWGAALGAADRIAACVSTPGVEAVIRRAAPHARPDAVWILSTKG